MRNQYSLLRYWRFPAHYMCLLLMSDYPDIDLFFMREGRTIQEYGMFSGSVLEAKTIGKENNSKNSAV